MSFELHGVLHKEILIGTILCPGEFVVRLLNRKPTALNTVIVSSQKLEPDSIYFWICLVNLPFFHLQDESARSTLEFVHSR